MDKPFCNKSMTTSAFFGMIRSALRRLSLHWKPRGSYLQRMRRPYTGDNKRLKWEYQCVACKDWYPQKEVEVDHIVSVGSIKSFDDIGGFVRRLFVEEEGYQILCKPCHLQKTHGGKKNVQ